MNGKNDLIKNFVFSFEDSKIFITKITDLLSFLIPKYKLEGKSLLTIGIGCTGGKHRSVCIAEELYFKLKQDHLNVNISHRDERLW